MNKAIHIVLFVWAVVLLLPACRQDAKSSLHKKYILFEPINRLQLDDGLRRLPNGMMVFDLESDSTFAYHLLNPRTGEANLEAGYQFKNTAETKSIYKNIQQYFSQSHEHILSDLDQDHPMHEARIYDGSHFLLLETENGELKDWVEFTDRDKPLEIESLTQLYRQENIQLSMLFKSYRIQEIDSLVSSFLIYPELTHYLDRKPIQSQTHYIIRENLSENNTRRKDDE